MTSPNDIVPQGDTPKQRVVNATRQLGRRRLVTGAGAGIMLIGSRSVLGSECYNPSETLSGAKSHTGNELPPCNGFSALYWLGLANGSQPWESISFDDVFTGANTGETFLQVLTADSSAANLHAALVAAVLNIRAGTVDARAMTEEYLVNRIWAEINSGGFYFPTPTSAWTPLDVVAYLKNTGIVG